MRDRLAEQLLARVMGWSPEEVAQERPMLQAMAAYKYDEYQRFSPGQRFIERLALWLNDLRTADEKTLAYRFVKERLIFFSTAEISHFATIAFPDFIRPRLLRAVAKELSESHYSLRKIAATQQYALHLRKCLFLGLSDGARTDTFRRANPELSNEQVLLSYEVSEDRVGKVLQDLRDDIKKITDVDADANEKFQTIVLIDDFSASGTSYVREEGQKIKGKIGEFFRALTDSNHPTSRLVNLEQSSIFLVLYIATDKAVIHLESLFRKLWLERHIPATILVVHPISQIYCLEPGKGEEIEPLLDAYYDECLEDEHIRKGGTDAKFGYAAGGLSVVLSHNTPNNSIYPLWADAPLLRPLFPRVSRHKEV